MNFSVISSYYSYCGLKKVFSTIEDLTFKYFLLVAPSGTLDKKCLLSIGKSTGQTIECARAM